MTPEATADPLTVSHKTIVRAGRTRVWQALTQDQELAKWFCTRARVDLRPGGEFEMAWENMGPDDYTGTHVALIEAVEEERRLVFKWESHGPGTQTTVEFTLEPRGPITIVHVKETGFGDNTLAATQNSAGWAEGLTWLKVWVENGIAYPDQASLDD